jgi:hypothetical protein
MKIFIPFCCVCGGEHYTDAEIKKIRNKFKDYLESIKEPKFYGGFIEIYPISKIYNKPIIILKIATNNNLYTLVAYYIDEDVYIYNLSHILFLL